MMLLRLKTNAFRNLAPLTLEPSNRFNLIYGLNGSGKTSLLEAVYFLGLGRSFRTNLTNRIIHYEEDAFSVFGLIADQSGISVATGIEKSRQGKVRIKVGNETTPTQADLAKALPIQLLNPDSYSLLTGGPKPRREFLDWGVFHVEPSFFSLWQRFQRALKQRNASLQQRAPIAQTKAWDYEITATGQELAQLRKQYVQKLTHIFFAILAELIDLPGLAVNFFPGWQEDSNLQEILDANFQRDMALGYTQAGPQRADLILKLNGVPVQDVLSRGEQKLLVLALRLAQGALLRDLTTKNCIYLLDDIAAELDNERRSKVLKFLIKLQAQVFATAVDRNALIELADYEDTKMFHVEHGMVAMA